MDAEIIIPRTEPAATSEAGQYLLHNVPRNQSRISVKIKNKYIHNESINLSQYSLKPSHNQDLIIDRINLWIHGNVKNRYGPVEGVIVMLNSSEANLVSETDSFGNFDFGEVRVHHKPIGRPMTLAFKSRDERDPRIKKPITIPLEEPYEINEKDLIWPLKDEVDVEGTVSSSENDRKLKNMLVMMKSEMGESSNYTNDSGYYSLRKVPIDAKDWFIYTPEGTILANGTIFPKLTVTDTQKNWRPLQIKA
ncbi:MAG: hypothetical protein MUO26_15460 [Methanotrichaceae archaeon]|nr:hypothetical protein [Methanotrichaceae archaeon]